MKIFIATLMIASAAGAAMAQEPAAQSPAKVMAEGVRVFSDKAQIFESNAKVVAELAGQGFAQQKNSPISADEVNESVQTLADGNRIVRSSTGKFYRNSEGRVRREIAGGVSGMLGSTFSFGSGVSISSPSSSQTYQLDPNLKTARVIELAQGQKGIAIEGTKLSDADIAKIEELKTQNSGQAVIAGKTWTMSPPAGFANSGVVGGFAISGATQGKNDTRIEELGTRDFEGVSAEGTRRTTTIPAGSIGNERPIEIVYERWFSKDLGMVVYSKNNDPRFGEQIYKLTNIVRSEPDPSLFAVPAEYKKHSENGTVYHVSPQSPTLTKPVTTAKPVLVSAPAAKTGRP